jgi:2-oxoglutarate ferredoxin oxidoreductase subunit delta
MPKGEIKVDRERCKGCQLCIEFCPKKCIAVSPDLNEKGYYPAMLSKSEACTGCSICAVVCPDLAIEVYRD